MGGEYTYYPEKESGHWEADDGTQVTPNHTHKDGTEGYDVIHPDGSKDHYRTWGEDDVQHEEVHIEDYE